ncbi:MAG: LCP family protein [bacterium]|nr:LCP family protein [bacterium]
MDKNDIYSNDSNNGFTVFDIEFDSGRKDSSDSHKQQSVLLAGYNKDAKTRKLIKKKKKQLIITNVCLSILLVITLVATSGLLIFQYVFSGFDSGVKLEEKDLGISSEHIGNKYTHIKNIALFGVDTRDFSKNKNAGRCDCVIILSVNTKQRTLKMVSILRDTLVKIEKNGHQKIAHSYVYGGAQLAVKTINTNFNMNITDYVTVNMSQLSAVIDLMGGIDIEITEQERVALNGLTNSEGFGIKTVPKSAINSNGVAHLNGGQAMCFARIRKIDSDNARVGRQSKVLGALLAKVQQMRITKYPGLLRAILSEVETSLTYSEIISYVPMATAGKLTLETMSVPGEEDNARGGQYDIYGNYSSSNAWVWQFDLDKASQRIHDWIYTPDADAADNQSVSEISDDSED